jgi:hypothetical protein
MRIITIFFKQLIYYNTFDLIFIITFEVFLVDLYYLNNSITFTSDTKLKNEFKSIKQ